MCSMTLRSRNCILEAVYQGNMGFEEMLTFYRKASDEDIRRMEKLLSKNKFALAWNLLKKVTGIKLMGRVDSK